MSSILKALKKLEEEKNRLQEPAGDRSVAKDILKPNRDSRRTVFWLSLVCLFALVVIATLSALLLAKRAPRNEAGNPVIAPATSPPAPSAAGRPAPPVTAGDDRQTLIPESPKPAPAVRQQAILSPGHAPGPPTEAVPRTLPELPVPPAGEQRAPQDKTQPDVIPVPAETRFTLSGIAWNKDSAERLAIINGQPAATGAVVNGFTVEEILPDRVRLSSRGKTLEIFLGSANKSQREQDRQ